MLECKCKLLYCCIAYIIVLYIFKLGNVFVSRSISVYICHETEDSFPLLSFQTIELPHAGMAHYSSTFCRNNAFCDLAAFGILDNEFSN